MPLRTQSRVHLNRGSGQQAPPSSPFLFKETRLQKKSAQFYGKLSVTRFHSSSRFSVRCQFLNMKTNKQCLYSPGSISLGIRTRDPRARLCKKARGWASRARLLADPRSFRFKCADFTWKVPFNSSGMFYSHEHSRCF